MMTLADISKMIVDCEHKTAPTQTDGYPSIRTPNIGKGYFLLNGVNRVSEETYRLWTKRAVPQPGDIIMAREAPVGNAAIVPDGLQACLGQRTLLIRPDPSKVEPSFLNYLLNGPQVQGVIHAKTNGVTVPHLNMKDVRELPIPDLPPLSTQRRIGGILSAYDELIENNQRRIQILEEMARALYREWFVEFRVPGHGKAKGPRSEDGGLPNGWVRTCLGDVAENVRRNVPKGDLEEPRPYVGLEHIPRRALALNSWDSVLFLGSNKLEFKRGEILFGKIRPYFHKVSIAPFDGLCSADTIVIRPKRLEKFSIVAGCVSSDEFVAHASATANGAKMPRASWEVLKGFQLVLPPEPVMKPFRNLFENAVGQQQVLVQQINNLRATRNLLLPHLLSGHAH